MHFCQDKIISRQDYLLIFIMGILFICRTIIFIFLPEQLGLKHALLFIVAGAFSDILPVVFLYLFLLKYKNKYIEVLISIYISVIICYSILNSFVMYYTRQILNFDILLQASYALEEYVLSLDVLTITAFLLGFFLIFIFYKHVFKCFHKLKISNPIYIYIGLAISSCLSLSFYHYGNGKYFHRGYFRAEWVIRPFIYNFVDIISDCYIYINKEENNSPRFGKLADADKKYMDNKGMIYKKSSLKYKKLKKIVLVAMESIDLQYLHSINKNIPFAVTKTFDNASASYISFDNFYTAAQPTTRGIHALLASRLDFRSDTYRVPNLFSELKKEGYVTYFLSAGTGYYGNMKKDIAYRYGPQHMFFSEYFEKKYSIKTKGWGVETSRLLNEVVPLLQKEEKTFIFVLTIDSHPPYGPRPSDINDICLKDDTISKNSFLLTLCSQDRALDEFLKKISYFLDDDTLIIITSDHSATHGANFTQRKELVPDRIPLIMITKNGLGDIIKNGECVHNYTSQIDLPVTLLDIMGIDIPQTFMGCNIFKKNVACTIHNRDMIKLIDQIGFQNYSVKESSPVANWFHYYYGKNNENK